MTNHCIWTQNIPNAKPTLSLSTSWYQGRGNLSHYFRMIYFNIFCVSDRSKAVSIFRVYYVIRNRSRYLYRVLQKPEHWFMKKIEIIPKLLCVQKLIACVFKTCFQICSTLLETRTGSTVFFLKKTILCYVIN